jgi:hypothetical protein
MVFSIIATMHHFTSWTILSYFINSKYRISPLTVSSITQNQTWAFTVQGASLGAFAPMAAEA